MKTLFNFILGISIFIYGIELFSNSFFNINDKLQIILKKYTKSILSGIILGTISTSIIQSSSIIMIITINLINNNTISFYESLGIMMGANLGTCITSWITSLLCIDSLNISFYLPIIFLIGLILFLKHKKRTSNLIIGYSFFLLGLEMIQNNLNSLIEYRLFKDIIYSLNNPILGLLIGFITTSIVQSSSATIAILQIISTKKKLTYYMTIPIILGENIGSCIVTLFSSINCKKNAKKLAFSHLLYNIIGSLIFIIIFYIVKYLNINYLYYEVNSYSIALIHTLFNLLSIFIFYPFINKLYSN